MLWVVTDEDIHRTVENRWIYALTVVHSLCRNQRIRQTLGAGRGNRRLKSEALVSEANGLRNCKCLRLALDHLRVANGGEALTSLHVSLDVDSLDPSLMNATGTPVPLGLDVEDVAGFLRELRRDAKITSADLVELNVELVDEATRGGYVDTARALARALLGEAGCAEPGRAMT